MTLSVTIPMWAIDGFMFLGCFGVVLSIMKISLDIYLSRLKRPTRGRRGDERQG